MSTGRLEHTNFTVSNPIGTADLLCSLFGRHIHWQGAVNHIGIVVDDPAAAEQRVVQAGFTPHSHASYEPGQRFYFNDHDDIEFEVISYA